MQETHKQNDREASTSFGIGLALVESQRRKNPGYYREVDRCCRFVIPEGVRVLELGCATSKLLAATRPCYGLGIDIDEKKVAAAREIHAGQNNLEFRVGDVEEMDFSDFFPIRARDCGSLGGNTGAFAGLGD